MLYTLCLSCDNVLSVIEGKCPKERQTGFMPRKVFTKMSDKTNLGDSRGQSIFGLRDAARPSMSRNLCKSVVPEAIFNRFRLDVRHRGINLAVFPPPFTAGLGPSEASHREEGPVYNRGDPFDYLLYNNVQRQEVVI